MWINVEKCQIAFARGVHLRPYGKCIEWRRVDRMYLQLSATVMLYPVLPLLNPPQPPLHPQLSSSSPAAFPSALVHVFMSLALFSVDDEIFSSFAAYHLYAFSRKDQQAVLACRRDYMRMTCTWNVFWFMQRPVHPLSSVKILPIDALEMNPSIGHWHFRSEPQGQWVKVILAAWVMKMGYFWLSWVC